MAAGVLNVKAQKKLNVFEKYLTIRVALCIVGGILRRFQSL